MAGLAFVTHPDCMKHLTGPGHPERPERLRAVLDAVGEAEDLEPHLQRLSAEPVDEEVLRAVHTPQYIEQVRRIAAEGGGALDQDTVVSPASFDAARLAAGAAVEAVRAAPGTDRRAAFAAVRPPGHHALPGRGMGFCLFNNVACAAAVAQHQLGRRRVLILDWDVHHGNGTQEIFYRSPAVLYLSLHQEHWYPGTGAMDETGAGDGVGFTINIPLPAGTGDGGYRHAFEEIVLPVVTAFAPEVVLISAGYDAHIDDPLGGMALTARGFYNLTALVRAAHAGPVVLVLEGGYALPQLGRSVVATLGALAGRPAPEAPPADELPYTTVSARVRAVRRIVRNYWNI
ncbi:MAG: histone deacetylase [Armatimonadota bacterium]|nr:histone deacetylase [Armatimonadota bacterium]MDR7451798.1 histone deacetylase [Armatimonadota bacterium]MDR7467423.1 histone deacetylase [Armatimonadota bacterium]MDR7494193.1 histone deacetylase [Armatimonadota bacterium]MDR7498841.1 histone deacetylase [Armatimonadota bacterium]